MWDVRNSGGNFASGQKRLDTEKELCIMPFISRVAGGAKKQVYSTSERKLL
jgi:hypothetical protein